MSETTQGNTSRREFLKTTGRVAATSTFMAAVTPRIYAGQDNTIKLALIGCGGRGAGAAANALATKSGPIKLVAMADVFEDRLKRSYDGLIEAASAPRTGGSADTWVMGYQATQIDVPPERRFLGFDAYQKAMDCLQPGDVVILTTPVAFRWVHFRYAIHKGINVFMEKPITVDGPTTRKMLQLAEESAKKNLKVGVGLMCRHCKARWELYDRIKAGPDRRDRPCCGPTACRVRRDSPAPGRATPASCSARSATTWASCGPAAGCSTTSSPTTWTSAAG